MNFNTLCESVLDPQVEVLSLHEMKTFETKHLVFHCCDCDCIIEDRPVTWEKFQQAVDNANGYIDKCGEEDFSPVVKEDVIYYYKRQCPSCKEESEDEPESW